MMGLPFAFDQDKEARNDPTKVNIAIKLAMYKEIENTPISLVANKEIKSYLDYAILVRIRPQDTFVIESVKLARKNSTMGLIIVSVR